MSVLEETQSPTAPPALNVVRLRGLLAEAQITHSDYARACGLHYVYVCGILTGRVQPGELAIIKLHRALVALGLDGQARHA